MATEAICVDKKYQVEVGAHILQFFTEKFDFVLPFYLTRTHCQQVI